MIRLNHVAIVVDSFLLDLSTNKAREDCCKLIFPTAHRVVQGRCFKKPVKHLGESSKAKLINVMDRPTEEPMD